MLKSDNINKNKEEPKKPARKIKEEPIPELILGGLPMEEKKEEPIMLSQGPIRLERIGGMFERVASAPTHIPRNFKEQFVIFETGGSYRLYIYMKNAWKRFNTS